MLRISIWNGRGMQHAEVSGGKWQMQAPHPISRNRTIQRAHGLLKWVAVGNTGFSELFMVDINDRGHAISLGNLVGGNLPNQTHGWNKGWLVSGATLAKRSPNSIAKYKQPTLAYSTTTIVDPSSIYIGIFMIAAASVGAARAKKTIGFVWKLDSSGQMYFVEGEAGSVCWGLGASAGIGVGFLTGFRAPSDIKGFTQFESGVNITGGAASLSGLKALAQHSVLLSKLQPALNVLKAVKNGVKGSKTSERRYAAMHELLEGKASADAHLKAVEQAAAFAREAGLQSVARQAGKTLSDIEIAKLILTCFGVDGSKKSLNCIMTEGGAEVSVHAGYNQITHVSRI